MSFSYLSLILLKIESWTGVTGYVFNMIEEYTTPVLYGGSPVSHVTCYCLEVDLSLYWTEGIGFLIGDESLL